MSNLTVCPVGSVLWKYMLISMLEVLVVKQSSSLRAVLATIFYILRHKMPCKNTSGSK